MAYVDITNSNYGITFRITYTQTSNVATNKSVVAITNLQIKSASYVGLYYFDGDITIDGVTVVDMSSSAGSHRASINATGTFYTVAGSLGSATFEHDATGNKTVTFALKSVAGWYNASSKKWTISGSKSVALTTIPRVSTFSVGNGTLGVEQDITVTKQNSSFSHTITYKCGVAKGTVCEKSTATTIKFTPPLELAEQNTSGTSLSITYTLQTYSGSTSVGSTTSKTVTLTIPASVKPVCSLSYMDETGYVDRFGGYVQGVSRLLVALLGEPAHFSPIVSYKTKIGNSTYTEATFSAPLTEAGEQTITATVTDGRGRSSDEVVETINVLAYAPPKISAFSVHRCNEDGTENSIGSFAKVTYSYSITSLSDQNSKYITLRYKKSNDTEYTAVPLESVYSAENAEYIFAADDGASYTITLEVADSLNTSQRSTSVSTADVIMHFRADAKGMGMGKVSEKANALDMGWDIELNDHDLLKNGVPLGAEDVGARPVDWMPTAEDVGAVSAIESTDYPGCFYRTIGGYDEWINPPMVANEEYRTTERYLGKVVYTKLVQFGALPNKTEKSVTAMPAGASLIDAIGIGYGSSYNVAIPGYYAIQSFGSTRSSGTLWISTTIDMSSYNGWIKIKYHKG